MNTYYEAVAVVAVVSTFIFLHKGLKRINLNYRKAMLKRARLREGKKFFKGRML